MADANYSGLEHWKAEQEKRVRALSGSGGGGTSGGMEARVAKLEAGIEFIGREITEIKNDVRSLRDNARTDFRVLFGAIIVAALGLAGIIAKGFHWL
jgi:hypothetical protein